MIIELIFYEIATGVLPICGAKVWADKRYLKGINQRKSTPLDGYLKQRVGKMSKTEHAVIKRVVKILHYATKFKALEYLLVLAVRHAQANALRT